jgi:hypothetical protein
VSIYAHEIAEVITDYYNDAWYFDDSPNSAVNENGDKCAGDYGTELNSNIILGSRSFLIQSMYLPGVGCVITNASAFTTVPTTAASRAPTPVNPTASPSIVGDIEYHSNNLVMKGTVNLYNIYIGDIDPSTKALIDYFTANIGSSTWFDIMGTYYDVIGDRTSLAANSTYFRGSKSFNSTVRGFSITLNDVIAIITNAVTTSNDWQPDSSGIYTVIFRGDFTFSIENNLWPNGWCSYRNTFRLKPTNTAGASSAGYLIKFTIIGDSSTTILKSDGARCQPLGGAPTANLNRGGDSIATYYAYNVASTVTNPYFKSWFFSSTNQDASSRCGMSTGNVQLGGKLFLLPQIWLRGYGCTLSATPNQQIFPQ